MEQTLNKAELNQEPFPSFDIEINKEDKDSDIEKPATHKDTENKEDTEAPHPERK
jgi:hypothetical protein